MLYKKWYLPAVKHRGGCNISLVKKNSVNLGILQIIIFYALQTFCHTYNYYKSLLFQSYSLQFWKIKIIENI